MKQASLLVALMLVALGVQAQQSVSREQDLIRRLRAQAQQLQQALSAEQQARQSAAAELQAARDSLDGEVSRLNAQAQAAARRAGAAQQRIEQLEREAAAQREQMSRELAQTRERLGRSEETLAQVQAELQARTRELESTQGRADKLSGRLGQCEQDNVALYRTGIEVLDHYRNRTLDERLGQAEPFSQIGRVRMENLVEAYRDRMEEHRSASLPAPAQP
jgi:chromosome segregation ATPase